MNDIFIIVLVFMSVYLCYWWFCFNRCKRRRKKTRDPQQRQMYAGSRSTPSLGQLPPTIYVSPANLPPPPKYEAIAPPSYEEVMGIQYSFQPPIGQAIAVQPITQPITDAVAHGSATANQTNTSDVPSATSNVTRNESPSTVVTVTTDTRTSLSAANSR